MPMRGILPTTLPTKRHAGCDRRHRLLAKRESESADPILLAGAGRFNQTMGEGADQAFAAVGVSGGSRGAEKVACLASERGHFENYQGANMALDVFGAAPIAVEGRDSAR